MSSCGIKIWRKVTEEERKSKEKCFFFLRTDSFCVRVKTRRRRRSGLERVGTAGGGEVDQRFKKLGVTLLDSQECPCHDHIQLHPGHPLIRQRYGGRSPLGGGGAAGRGQAGPPHHRTRGSAATVTPQGIFRGSKPGRGAGALCKKLKT